MGNLPGKSAEQFSRAWNVFVTTSLCMLFGVGKSLCNNFFTLKKDLNNRKHFSPWLPFHEFFQQFGLCRNFFCLEIA